MAERCAVQEEIVERKIDPDDGLEYSLAEFKLKYDGIYDDHEALALYHTQCLHKHEKEAETSSYLVALPLGFSAGLLALLLVL